MIDRQSQLPIGRQAELLGISRGSVYYLPKPVSERDLDIMRRLDELHLKHPVMGLANCVISSIGKASRSVVSM